ncbi:MAG: ribonuclease J [Patescibacteria group bacterium]
MYYQPTKSFSLKPKPSFASDKFYYRRKKNHPKQPQSMLPTAVPSKFGEKLKIIPLGGQEEVGRNMTVFEYGNDIVILDMGLQFPEEDTPGVDYIIPDIRYLKGKEKNIRGVIISHGHLDHIGAIAHLMPKLGWPPIYASKMTLALIRRRLEESNLQKYLKINEIKSANEQLRLGNFKINFFSVTHSIMDAVGIIIQTPFINIIHPGDWRYDLEPIKGPATDFSQLAGWNTRTAPSILMAETLGSTQEGKQMSEQEVYKNIKRIIEQAPSRIIIATFASMVERVAWIVEIAEMLGKKVAFDGYSMKTNIEIAKNVGYIKYKPSTIIDIKHLRDYPDNKVIIVCTGAQGEDRAVLMRIANHEHKQVKLKKSDTIIFSSSVIPGNERTIQRLKDTLYRQCDNVIHKEIMGVHGGGHALIEDIKLLLQQVKPKYFFPVYANHYLLQEGAKVATSIGFPKQNIFILDNGSIAEITQQGIKMSPHKIPIEYVFVDGLGVGDVSQVVIRDRQILAADGMLVIVATIDGKTGQPITSPDIISRGFVYMKDNKKLVEETRTKVKQILKAESLKPATNDIYLKDKLRNDIGKFLYTKTERRPMILTVIIEV